VCLRFKLTSAERCTLMDKAYASRKQKHCARFSVSFLAGILFTAVSPQAFPAITLSHAEALRIGKRIWQNECNGTVSGLTSWNVGEDFASLGIGHFIWYPEGKRGPFEESFPKLIRFISDHDVDVPSWLQNARTCPWQSQSDFQRAQNSPELKALRDFLVHTVDLQAQFLVDRLQNALPKMIEETAPFNRVHVQEQFERMSSSAQGCYALVDYVNFKGEGVLHTERYRGEGWGLLQVLEDMRGTSNGASAVEEFARSASTILTHRVKNSPPERNESRWLPGWVNRVNSYTRG
jgi:hypothetical protein